MPTAPLLDLDALTAPIPGPDPAGKSVPFAVREQLETARKETDTRSFDKGDPLRPSDEQRADWALVIRLATETVSQTSKDLLIAARLTEALTKRYGFAGARDGLGLLRRLAEDCWDRLLPPIEEEEDAEVRAAAFAWLSDPDRGARFPHT
ncbi:MAG: type VI secretion system ImpA family N-terminal domain-containing protein, partial [Planctomycetia bacterium]|nr:type VI secretion system ImpA family N-terminal domain-containing protein [Planctomycetia bacterium]